MPNVLPTPTNVSSPTSAIRPSAPSATSAYPTTLKCILDVFTKQPTSQMDEPDVTPNLFSLTIPGPTSIFEMPEPTTIPKTLYQPTIFETPIDRIAAPQSAQSSPDRPPSERKLGKTALLTDDHQHCLVQTGDGRTDGRIDGNTD